jgi:thiosulfate reductase cytochrome b subunit
MPPAEPLRNPEAPRHTALVRVTHWVTVLAFLALLVTGIGILISHPRFYWGETGNSGTQPLFRLHIPSSRPTVPSGYNYLLPDENGWSRYLHFEAAWVAVLTGLLYGLYSFWTGHFRRDLFPAPGQRSWRAYWDIIAKPLRRAPPDPSEAHSYNPMQRAAYLAVIFILFPLVIWTGLAMSPSFDSALPAAVNLLGGVQSARTLHFFVSIALVLFLVVHVAMVAMAGFRSRMRGMITGCVSEAQPTAEPASAILEERA